MDTHYYVCTAQYVVASDTSINPPLGRPNAQVSIGDELITVDNLAIVVLTVDSRLDIAGMIKDLRTDKLLKGLNI